MRPRSIWWTAAAMVMLAQSSAAQQLNIPPRDPFMTGGGQLVVELTPLTRENREARLRQEFLDGNIPPGFRTFVPVTFTRAAGGVTRSVTVFVSPDYITFGSDTDGFLAPMTPMLAQQLANAVDCFLPTKLLVDRIYAAAPVKLRPQPIPPSAEMTTVPVFAQHNDSVRALRSPLLATYPVGTLVGGTKKDIVTSHRIYEELRTGVPRPVVIYGWHQLNGSPIQPVYNGHGETYADYSHGVRLVLRKVVVDGDTLSYDAILSDPVLYILLNEDKPLTKPYYGSPTGTGYEGEGRPEGFRLDQNYPNPFNPATTIPFTLGRDGRVRLEVFDLLGRRIGAHLDEQLPAGNHAHVWHGEGSTGVLVYRLSLVPEAGPAWSVTRRMLQLR